MRKARVLGLTAGASALAVAIVGAMTSAAPAAMASHTVPLTAKITIKPSVHTVTRAKAATSPWTTAQCESLIGIACYEPDQVRAAYNLAPLYKKGITGKGSTILIVDSFGSPTIKADLHKFDTTFGYPDPPSFKIVAPAGKIPAYDPNFDNGIMVNWASETTLDVEWAHTIAPGANIVLAETPDAETEGITGFPNIVKAEDALITHPERYGIKGKITVISQSFGATEETFTGYSQVASLRQAYKDAYKRNITVLAATGDEGATSYELDGSSLYTKPVTGWPATDPLVTAVGGTQIKESASGAYSQVVWNDSYDVATQQAFFGTNGPNALATGGGVSEYFGLPTYQRGVARTIAAAIGAPQQAALPRAIPDISMSGACNGVVDYYTSFGGNAPGWHLVCGTSEATPLFSGIVALSAQVAHHSLGLINPKLYAMAAAKAPGLVDITSGNNTVGFAQGSPAVNYTVNGYSAGNGYDLASGVGTVNAALFVPELGHNGNTYH